MLPLAEPCGYQPLLCCNEQLQGESCSLAGHVPNVSLQTTGNNMCPYSLVLLDACAQDKRLTACKVSQVKPENGTDFENVWKNRESKLLEMPGFIRFALLRGDEEGMQNPAVRLSNIVCRY